jgi:protein involved in polysaccharide export with SLBB domain
VTFSIEIKAKSGAWVFVNMNTECYELSLTTNHQMPFFTTLEAQTRCTILVLNLKSKYLLQVGDTVEARITATHAVGAVTSASGGTAVLPVDPCFRTTFPRVVAGTNADTAIMAMDVDDKGHIIVGGTTLDSGLLLKTPT